MPFGRGKKVAVDVRLDAEQYRPGDAIGITVVVSGDDPSRVRGGEAMLRCRVERRSLEREPDEIAEGNLLALIPTEKRELELRDLRAELARAAGSADDEARLEGALRLPDDAPPTLDEPEAMVEWQLMVFVKRKGMDRAERLIVRVAPPAG